MHSKHNLFLTKVTGNYEIAESPKQQIIIPDTLTGKETKNLPVMEGLEVLNSDY